MSSPAPLQFSSYYHIYNRGFNDDIIFFEEHNYAHFLNLYQKHIEPVADTFAYCLLRNHFHIFVKIKAQQEITKAFTTIQFIDTQDSFVNNGGNAERISFESDTEESPSPSKYFSDFFNAYAKAINASYGRNGSLFQHPFGRVMITPQTQFIRVTTYIHQNPQKHGYVDDFREWEYSSFGETLSEKTTCVKRDVVMKWFGDDQKYIDQHTKWVTKTQSESFSGDDFN